MRQDIFKILFIITIKDSFGERTHALSFVKQLLKQINFSPIFFVGDNNLKSFFEKQKIKSFYFDKYEELTNSIINENPNLIICCEYYHLTEKFRDFLSSLKIPIATIDGTSMGDEINSTIKTNILPSNIIKLRPCPINDPLTNTENIKYWNLFPELQKNILDKEFIKRYYKIPDDSKIIFMAISMWEISTSKFLGLNIDNFYNNLFSILFLVFQNIKHQITFFIISPFKQDIIKNKNLTVHFLNVLEYELYQKLLLSSDLVLSTNIIQTSMSQAFIEKIKTLALINTKNKKLFEYEFNIFPLKIKFPEDREYYQLINKAEIFDIKEIFEKVNFLLNSDEEDKKINDYIFKIKSLKNVCEITQEIIKKNKGF